MAMSAESLLNASPPPLRSGLQRRLKPLLLGGTVLLVILKIVALSPAPLEESGGAPRIVDLDELVLREGKTLAPGIPQGKVPDYAINKFNYVSTHKGEKQWNMIAEEAYFFNSEKLVHSRIVRANLYDTEGKITVVTGLESKYLMNQNDLEIFGDVKTVLPDGFVVKSDYMRYKPKEKKIEIPISTMAEGEGVEEKGEKMHFTSHGLEFDTGKSEIYLPKDARLTLTQDNSNTLVLSDHCLIHRKQNLADFTMIPERPSESRFVQIEQPTMYARGRSGKLKYGSSPNMIQDMTLFDDVFVQEFTVVDGVKNVTRYGTGGRGDFDSHRNLTILTIYPQVYQDDDTLTGDRITMHRESDVVEVEHSNGFSTGNNDPDSKPSPKPNTHP